MRENAFGVDIGMSVSPYIIEVDEHNFAEAVIESSRQVPVLVDFWADWCAPCRALGPLLEKLAAEYRGGFILAKVNTDQQQGLAMQLGIRSLPTCKLVRDGQVADEFTGALPEGQVRAFLEPHVARGEPSASDQLRRAGLEAFERGDLDTALTALRQARGQSPDDAALTVELARVTAAAGDAAGAEALLDAIPAEEAGRPEVRALRAELRITARLADAPDAGTLRTRLEHDSADSEAAYYLALHRLAQGDREGALRMLFELMRRDRTYGEDVARKTLLEIFDVLGDGDPLVKDYRRRLFTALY